MICTIRTDQIRMIMIRIKIVSPKFAVFLLILLLIYY